MPIRRRSSFYRPRRKPRARYTYAFHPEMAPFWVFCGCTLAAVVLLRLIQR